MGGIKMGGIKMGGIKMGGIKMGGLVVNNIRYADDTVINADPESQVQH